jgi:glucuronosyltransferase
MWNVKTIVILGLIALMQGPTPTTCARILGVFPCPSKSHLVVFTALTKELARRGHELVVVSPYPLSKPMANYTDIDIMSEMQDFMDAMMGAELYEMVHMPTFAIPIMFWEEGLTITSAALRHSQVKDLLNDKKGFDLVIVEDFMTDALYAFAQYFKVSLFF